MIGYIFVKSVYVCGIQTAGMFTDIQINPDNLLPGNIRIINYLF